MMVAFTRSDSDTAIHADAPSVPSEPVASSNLSSTASMDSTQPAEMQGEEYTPLPTSTAHAPQSIVSSDFADAPHTPPCSPRKTAQSSTPKTPSRSPPKIDRNQTGTPLRRRFLKEVAMSPQLSSAPCTPPRSPTRTPSPTKRNSPMKSPSKSPIKTPSGSPPKINKIAGPNGTLEIGAGAFYFSCELPARKIVPSKAKPQTPKKSDTISTSTKNETKQEDKEGDKENKENAGKTGGEETVLRLKGRATHMLGRTRTPSPDKRGERKQERIPIALTSKEGSREKEMNIGHLMAELGKAGTPLSTNSVTQGQRKKVVILDTTGTPVVLTSRNKSEPPTPLRAAARTLSSTEYRVMPMDARVEGRIEKDTTITPQAQAKAEDSRPKSAPTKQVVTKLPKPRRVGTDPDLRAAMRKEMEHVEESLSRSTGLDVSFQSHKGQEKRKDSLDMSDVPGQIQTTTTEAPKESTRKTSLPRFHSANKPAAAKPASSGKSVSVQAVKMSTKPPITSTRKTSLPQLRPANKAKEAVPQNVTSRTGAVTPENSKSAHTFLKKGSGSVNRYSPGRTPPSRQQEKPDPLQRPKKPSGTPLTQSPSSGNKGRPLTRSPTRRGFRRPISQSPVNGILSQKSGSKTTDTAKSMPMALPPRRQPDLHTPLKPGPVAGNSRQQITNDQFVSGAEIAERITKWNGGGIKVAISKARVESTKSGQSSKATSPSKTPALLSPAKTTTTAQASNQPSYTPPGSPEKVLTSPPTKPSSESTTPSTTPSKKQVKPTNAFLARLSSPKHPPPTPKAKQALPMATPKPTPSAVQRLRGPATPGTPATLRKGKSKIAVLDRGALRTPSKEVAEALDRAIDRKIEEERGRYAGLAEKLSFTNSGD